MKSRRQTWKLLLATAAIAGCDANVDGWVKQDPNTPPDDVAQALKALPNATVLEWTQDHLPTYVVGEKDDASAGPVHTTLQLGRGAGTAHVLHLTGSSLTADDTAIQGDVEAAGVEIVRGGRDGGRSRLEQPRTVVRHEGERAGFALHTTLNRKDFGINWNKALDNGGVLLGDDVEVSINLETVKSKADAKETVGVVRRSCRRT